MSDNIKSIVGYSLNTRKETRINRALAKGSSKTTEHYSYEYTIPLIENQIDETKLIRIAALIANTNVAHGDQKFGEWVRRNIGENVRDRIVRLVNFQFDQAIEEVSRIIKMDKNQSGAFNWFDLAKTLFYWGKGVTDSSIDVRQRIAKDYFRVSEVKDLEDIKSEEESDTDVNE